MVWKIDRTVIIIIKPRVHCRGSKDEHYGVKFISISNQPHSTLTIRPVGEIHNTDIMKKSAPVVILYITRNPITTENDPCAIESFDETDAIHYIIMFIIF